VSLSASLRDQAAEARLTGFNIKCAQILSALQSGLIYIPKRLLHRTRPCADLSSLPLGHPSRLAVLVRPMLRPAFGDSE
jgi:hypothetical protein